MAANPSSAQNALQLVNQGYAVNLNPFNLGAKTDVQFGRFEKLASVKNVSANSVGVAEIPTGDTYYSLIFFCKDGSSVATSIANIKTSITNIVLKLDGEEHYNISPTDLYALQGYYGDNIAAGGIAGILEFDLAEIRQQREAKYVEQMAYGTANVQSMTVDFTFGTLTSLASIEVYAVRARTRKPLGAHKKVLTYSRSFASTGDQEIDTLPRTPNRLYRALHVDDGAGAINSIAVALNGDKVHDAIPNAVAQLVQERCGRNPQTGYYSLDFNLYGEIFGGLPMIVSAQQGNQMVNVPVSDFRTTINWGTSPGGTYRIIAETMETPN
jgi:hypothetical protein